MCYYSNDQLSSLCISVGKSGWGISWMLKRRILNHLQNIQKDDQVGFHLEKELIFR